MTPSPTLQWIPFRWQSARLGERDFPHAAMFLLGTLPSLDGLQGWLQFDLGAPITILYEKAFSPAQQERIGEHPHRPRPAVLNGREMPVVDLSLHIGPWSIERVAWFLGFGDDAPLPDDGRPILGTLGADWAHGHIVVLDFPNQRLSRCEALPPAWEEQARWAPLRRSAYGHVVLQITVDGTPRWAMFDTGSSLFHLLTDPYQWQQLTTGEVSETFPITAWGESMEVTGGLARARFALGGQPLAVPIIHYLEGEDRRRFLEDNDLVGILGNAPFLEHILVLDFPRQRCGVVPPPARTF